MRKHLRFSLCAVGLLVGASYAADPAAPNQPAPARKAAATPKSWPVLKKGMAADDVLRAIGKPDSIRTMDTPEGKAEVWNYRRLANSVMRQTPVAMQNQPSFTGIGLGNDTVRDVGVPLYRNERVNVYQVSSLLMFDGKFVTATQKVEQESHFE